VRRLAASGLTLLVPVGWEARLTVPARSTGVEEGVERPYLHVANFALPPRRAPFGAGVVASMRPTDVFAALVEYDPTSAATPLFSSPRAPSRLQHGDFASGSVQRAIRGQSGVQRFFHTEGRAFCLYVVAGGQPAFRVGLADLNALLHSLRVAAAVDVA
jgi:hypothetical protein